MDQATTYLLHLLWAAAGAETPAEKARVAWRASDYMWQHVGTKFDLPTCRIFNNMLQDLQEIEKWPWIEDLWSMEEVKERYNLHFQASAK
jgi:hypothetical protein